LVPVGSAAAALVLLVAIGVAAGLVHVHLELSGSGSGTTLTSVSGCDRLEQAVGTLERVNGARMVIREADGQLVTVTSTATTRLAATGPLLSAITNGAAVTVAGTSSRQGIIAADFVVVGRNPPSLAIPGVVMVRGTVSDASAAGFTVMTSAGTRASVFTSAATVVTVSHATLSQLQDGGRTMAVGYAGSHGTLSALAVVQPPDWPAGAHARVTVRNCSSTAINHEIAALAAGA
jgi:hypothetical protein